MHHILAAPGLVDGYRIPAKGFMVTVEFNQQSSLELQRGIAASGNVKLVCWIICPSPCFSF